MMGMDAFSQLHLWYQWEKILTLANILLIDRPIEITLPEILQKILNTRTIKNKKKFLNAAHGYIFHFNAGLYDISSTKIRNNLAHKENIALPSEVLNYIEEHHLYPRN